MKLFLSPHNDDAVLFGCFTLLREKPLVLTVTDSWIQFNRGETCTAEDRWKEDVEAMKVLGCSIIRGGIRDDVGDDWAVRNLLQKFSNFDTVYAPAVMGGNPHHDLIGKIAGEIFGDKCKHYTTYTRTNLHPEGTEEVVPTLDEILLKNEATLKFKSQLAINGPHFEAVKGKSEWFI